MRAEGRIADSKLNAAAQRLGMAAEAALVLFVYGKRGFMKKIHKNIVSRVLMICTAALLTLSAALDPALRTDAAGQDDGGLPVKKQPEAVSGSGLVPSVSDNASVDEPPALDEAPTPDEPPVPGTVRIRLFTDGGSYQGTEDAVLEAEAFGEVALESPVKEGCGFLGWTVTGDAKLDEKTGILHTAGEDLILTANYAPLLTAGSLRAATGEDNISFTQQDDGAAYSLIGEWEGSGKAPVEGEFTLTAGADYRIELAGGEGGGDTFKGGKGGLLRLKIHAAENVTLRLRPGGGGAWTVPGYPDGQAGPSSGGGGGSSSVWCGEILLAAAGGGGGGGKHSTGGDGTALGGTAGFAAVYGGMNGQQYFTEEDIWAEVRKRQSEDFLLYADPWMPDGGGGGGGFPAGSNTYFCYAGWDPYWTEALDGDLGGSGGMGYLSADTVQGIAVLEAESADGANGHDSYAMDGSSGYIRIYAVSSTLTIDPAGGSYEGECRVKDVRGAVYVPAVPCREGYRFEGWKPDGGGSIEGNRYIFGETDGTLTALWTPEVYKILLHLQGGEVKGDNPSTYTVETETFTLCNPVKEGCHFGGWSGAGADHSMTVTVDQGSLGDREYTAVWQEAAPLLLDSSTDLSMAPFTAADADGNPVEYRKGGICLDWTRYVGDASGYNLYRMGEGDQEFVKISELQTDKSYRDPLANDRGLPGMPAGCRAVSTDPKTAKLSWSEPEDTGSVYRYRAEAAEDIMSGGSVTFSYTGGIRSFTAPIEGTYGLEVWGASGGGNTPGNNSPRGSYGGLGGFAAGEVWLKEGDTVYVTVGGAGRINAVDPDGGYNGGGGQDTGSGGGGSGGGATHIARRSGLLADLSDQRESVLIVAGGGGGSDDIGDPPDVEKSYASGWNDGRGGAGGGICGGNAWYCSQWILTEMAGTGGTQTSGWAFGKGEPVLGSGWDPGAGGGGWYGGRSSLKGTGGGGGGSGYLSPELKNGSFGEADRWGSGMAVITLPSAYTKTAVSNIREETVTSGIQGYLVLPDDEPDTEVTMENGVYTAQPFITVEKSTAGYVHIAAVDKAGNVGPSAHQKLDLLSLETKADVSLAGMKGGAVLEWNYENPEANYLAWRSLAGEARWEKIYGEPAALKSCKDEQANDLAAPEKVRFLSVLPETAGCRIQAVVWEEPEDNGTSYDFKTEAYAPGSSDCLDISNICTETLLSGVMGYLWKLDSSPRAELTPGADEVHLTAKRRLDFCVKEAANRYVHIAAIDRAGNIGPVSDFLLATDAVFSDLRIRVLDQITEEPLENVELSVYAARKILNPDTGAVLYEKDELVEQAVTDAGGEALIRELYGGDYYIRETRPRMQQYDSYASAYELPKEVYPVHLRTASEESAGEIEEEIIQTIYNLPLTGTLKVEKTDEENGNPVAAAFEITAAEDILHPDGKSGIVHEKGSHAGSIRTGASGSGEFAGLFPGKYCLTEKEAPGYLPDQEIHEFTVTASEESGLNPALKLTNLSIKGKIIYSAADSRTGYPLEGVQAGLYAAEDIRHPDASGTVWHQSGRLVAEITTGPDGTAEVTADLDGRPVFPGRYYFLESAPRAGYEKTVRRQELILKPMAEDGPYAVAKALCLSSPLSAEAALLVRDIENRNPLRDVRAALYAAEDLIYPDGSGTVIYEADERVAEVVTDEDGRGFIDQDKDGACLLPGTYYFKQTEARTERMDTYTTGYLRSDEKAILTLDAKDAQNKEPDRALLECTPVKGAIELYVKAEEEDAGEGAQEMKKSVFAGSRYSVYAAGNILHPDGRTGAVYEADDLIGLIEIGEDGSGVLEGLYLGCYRVVESSTVPGYEANSGSHLLTISYLSPETACVTARLDITKKREKPSDGETAADGHETAEYEKIGDSGLADWKRADRSEGRDRNNSRNERRYGRIAQAPASGDTAPLTVSAMLLLTALILILRLKALKRGADR